MTLNSIRQHNQTVLDSLEDGDLVEFPRGLYSHWAVYVGNEEVVHLAGDPNAASKVNANSSHVFAICGKQFTKAQVKLDNFFKVAADSKAKKNNDKDDKVSPSDKREIVRRAMSKLGEIGYNILWENCEYFASWCRYGEGWSEQTITALKVVGGTAVVAAGAALLYTFFGNKEKKN
ncbi:hypothetical protein ACJMK2_034720 [Sinanodonta woodiana]|uniref:LRAT domain-containing protein n=1 Tax=Sinanodonta woodiana TaxID=1069815 RepID=A0ABD3WU97_SINWO